MLCHVDTFDAVGKNFKSAVGKKYSRADVIVVWNKIADLIEEALRQGKGIRIKDLGTFTLSEWKLNVGNQILSIKKPVFCIAEKLKQFYNLKTQHVYVSGKIPLQMLNFATVANGINKSRCMVEECVSEVVQAFIRLLNENVCAEFPFASIGKLQVQNKVVQVKFYHDFLKRIDDASEKYIKEKSSPNDAVIFGKATPLEKHRPTDRYTTVMPPADCECDKQKVPSSKSGQRDTFQASCHSNIVPNSPKYHSECKMDTNVGAEKNYISLQNDEPLDNVRTPERPRTSVKSCPSSRSSERKEIKNINCCCTPVNVIPFDKKFTSKSCERLQVETSKCDKEQRSIHSAVSCRLGSEASAEIVKGNEPSTLYHAEDPNPDPELCYNCQLQKWRAFRHRPRGPDTPFIENCKARALDYKDLKDDAEAVRKEWEKEDMKRQKTTELAMYNKMIGDCRREENMKKEIEPAQAYVLYQRPDTPKLIDWELATQLKEQIKYKEDKEKKQQEIREIRDQEKHKKLTEELEAMHWLTAQEIDRKKRELKFSLDTQIQCKKDYQEMFRENPSVETDTRGVPIGFRDLKEQRRKANEIRKYQEYQQQYKHEKEKKEQEDKLNYEKLWLIELKKEAEENRRMSKRNHLNRVQDLFNSWNKTQKEREERNKEELASHENPKYLLEEICPRCKICKKKLGHRPGRITEKLF